MRDTATYDVFVSFIRKNNSSIPQRWVTEWRVLSPCPLG